MGYVMGYVVERIITVLITLPENGNKVLVITFMLSQLA